MVRRLWVMWCAVAVLLFGSPAHAGQQATELVRQRQAAVFAARGRPAVQRALKAMFDYDAMATAVETKRWATLPPSKRAELRRLIKRGLMRNHEVLLATKRKHHLTVTLTGQRATGAATRVSAAAKPRNDENSAPIAIDYIVSGSRIIDLRLEGVSQVKASRRQLDRALRQHGIDALLAKLKAKVDAPPAPFSRPFPVSPKRQGSSKPQAPSARPRGGSDPVAAAVATMVVAAVLVVSLWWRAHR